jgi:hypothetical protein
MADLLTKGGAVSDSEVEVRDLDLDLVWSICDMFYLV